MKEEGRRLNGEDDGEEIKGEEEVFGCATVGLFDGEDEGNSSMNVWSSKFCISFSL